MPKITIANGWFPECIQACHEALCDIEWNETLDEFTQRHQDHLMIGIYMHGKPAGAVFIEFIEPLGFPLIHAGILMFARGHVGIVLTRIMEGLLKTHGVLFSNPDPANHSVINLIKRLGFIPTADGKMYWRAR